MDENSIPEDSVIILTTDEMDELNLEEGRQIIVNPVGKIYHFIFFFYYLFLCDKFVNLDGKLVNFTAIMHFFSSGV